MEYLIGYIVGVVMCAIVGTIFDAIRYGWGTLQIDHSDPEKDVYRISINDLDALNKKKRVILKIDHDADLSQK